LEVGLILNRLTMVGVSCLRCLPQSGNYESVSQLFPGLPGKQSLLICKRLILVITCFNSK